jgi:hypothetical protein
MHNWWKAIGIMSLWIALVGLITKEWEHLRRYEGRLQEHIAQAFDAVLIHKSVRITGLWGGRAVRSAGTRFHLVA